MGSSEFNRRPHILPAIIVLLAMLSGPLAARGAEGVYRDHITPRWFDHQTRFWYRVDVAKDAYQFVLVDAERGTRKLAFDHAKVAAALAKATGQAILPDRLPIDRLIFSADLSAVTLVGRGKTKDWLLDLASGAIRPTTLGSEAARSLPTDESPPASQDDGGETFITFENRESSPIDVYWMTPHGARKQYQIVKPGKTWKVHTFAGHVWLATDAAGRTLDVFQAIADPSTAIVDGKPVASAPATQPAPIAKPTGPVSPDGNWAAFIQSHNLYVRRKSDGRAFALSTDGKVGDDYSLDEIYWSPDSQKLAALRIEVGEDHKIYTVESSPPDQVQPKLRVLDYRKPGDRIEHPRPELFHVGDFTQIPIKDDLFPNPWSIDDVRWAADSSRFTFFYNQRGHQILRIIGINADTGAARPIVDERSDTFIDYSGKYFCRWIGDGELIWMSERDGWNHLWLYDAKTGRVKNRITTGNWVVQRVQYVDTVHRQLWFFAGGIRPGEDPYDAEFCRVNFDGSGLTILTDGDGNHHPQWTPGSKMFVDTWSRVDLPPITELRSADNGKLICPLEKTDAHEALAARGGRWPEPFVAKGRDGRTDIHGFILYPHDFDPHRKYPVLEDVYAGPQSHYVPKSFHADYGAMQRLADRGMIVVQSDGMGTSGRSKAFHDVCWKNLRDAGFPDRIAWIKSAAAQHPQMDLSRVGIYGGSAGGQNAMAALLWHNDFYKVAFADCGCHDNRMDKIWWNEQWMGWPVDKSYAENSNVVNAHLLKGKLMLMVGEMDNNVDPSSTMQVVNALEKANKDFELIVITGAHHGSAEMPYGSKRRTEFLVRNLIGDEGRARN